MIKLLSLIGLFISTTAFASCPDVESLEVNFDDPTSFTYFQVDTFTMLPQDNAIGLTYGLKTIYPSRLATNFSVSGMASVDSEFLLLGKMEGLFYLNDPENSVKPFVGVGVLGGLYSMNKAYDYQAEQVRKMNRQYLPALNSYVVVGMDFLVNEKPKFVAATYHYGANTVMISVGRSF